jgi:ferredoxin
MRRNKVKVDKKICIWCGGCVAVCPSNALTLFETIVKINERCNGCRACMRFCPMGAIKEEL